MDLEKKKQLLSIILERKKEKKFWEEDRWKGKLDPGITLTMPKSYATQKQTEFEKTGLKAIINKATTDKKAKQQEVHEKIMEMGIAPDVRDKNIWGKMGAYASFPLKKVVSAGMAFPRAISAAMASTPNYSPLSPEAKMGGADKLSRNLFYGEPLDEPPGSHMMEKQSPAESFRETLKEGRKLGEGYPSGGEVAKEAGRAFINLKGSKYQDYSIGQFLKERYPEGWGAQPFEFTEDTDDWVKGTNWIQKIGAGIFGTPFDVGGLAADIILDPITYITAGVGTGANTGIKSSTNITSKTGETLFKKGSHIALKQGARQTLKAGWDDALKQAKEAYKFIKSYRKVLSGADKSVKPTAATTTKLVNAFKKLGINVSKTNTYDDMLKWSKVISEVPEEGVEAIIRKKVTENLVKNMFSKMPTAEAKALIDYGGIKFGGATVIPGYKFQGAGDVLQKFVNKPVMGRLSRLLSTKSGYVDEFIPAKAYIESSIMHRGAEGAGLLTDIFKGLKKDSIKRIDDYLGYSYDIGKAQTILKKATAEGNTKYIKKLNGIIDDLTKQLPKLADDELLAANKYRTQFLDDFLKKTEIEWGSKYTPIENYFISRTTPVGEDIAMGGWGRNILGVEKAPYQYGKKYTYSQLKELVKQGEFKKKDLLEASLQRISESASNVGRKQMLNEAKGFGSLTKQPGYVQSTLPELKGWYFPEEIVKPLERQHKAFFGEQGVNTVAKVYDKIHNIWKRWALATPGFHARNLYSDGWSGWMEWGMDFFNPRYWKNAVAIKRGQHVLIDVGEYGKVYADDMARIMGKSGEKGAGFTAGEALTQTTGKKVVSKIDPSVWSTKAGAHREDMGRIVGGLIERSKGSTDRMAAMNVKKVFYDYFDLTSFEKAGMKRFFPFYTWARRNLPRQLQLMATRPGKYAAIGKVRKYFENITSEDRTREDYDLHKEDWREELQLLPTNWKTSEGEPLDLWANLPFGDVQKFDLSGKGLKGTFFDMLTPLAKVPLEAAMKRNTFYDSEMDLDAVQEAPKWLSETLGKLPNSILNQMGMKKDEKTGKMTVTNRAMHNLSLFPPVQNLTSLTPPEYDTSVPFKALSTGAGIKLFPYDKEKAKTSYQNEFINEVRDSLKAQEKLTDKKALGLDEINVGMKFMYTQYLDNKYADQIRKAEALKLLADKAGGDKGKVLKALAEKQIEEYEEEIARIKGLSQNELYRLLNSIGIEATEESIRDALNTRRIQQMGQ